MDIENVEIWKGIPITHAVCEVHWGHLRDVKVLHAEYSKEETMSIFKKNDQQKGCQIHVAALL